jgi:hypothetical protein
MAEEPVEELEATQEELEVAPVRHRADWVEALGGISLGGIVMGGVTLAVIAAATPTHTMGATRSAQVVWERRQIQIEAALAEEHADEPGPEEARSDG